MWFVIWRVVAAVLLAMLTLATAENGRPTIQRPVSVSEPVSRAVFGLAGTAASPAGFAMVSQELSDPSWVMPDLTGWRLNAAKREILRLTDGNVSSLKSHDGSGSRRAQFWDPDWKVCSQNVPSGARITTTTTIDFGVVKIRENC